MKTEKTWDEESQEQTKSMWAAGKVERDHDKDIMASMIAAAAAESRRSHYSTVRRQRNKNN